VYQRAKIGLSGHALFQSTGKKLALDCLIHQTSLGLYPASPSWQISFEIRNDRTIGSGNKTDHIFNRTSFACDDTGSVIHILPPHAVPTCLQPLITPSTFATPNGPIPFYGEILLRKLQFVQSRFNIVRGETKA